MRRCVYELTQSGCEPRVPLPAPQAEGVLSAAPDSAIHYVTGQSPRNSATGGWVNAQLIVSGGRADSDNMVSTEVYDLREDKWAWRRECLCPRREQPVWRLVVAVGEHRNLWGKISKIYAASLTGSS